eukprot:TRINITY_DN20590_c0_g1_i1.p1 TRINITY_DN20590_c0_g1~~TRINITY_DN20590_c0_g1_i1.p1  ORF type:complete len:292 (+),score=65.64 TRINITY_DN20590_c0_g1_i1:121-996(+)
MKQQQIREEKQQREKELISMISSLKEEIRLNTAQIETYEKEVATGRFKKEQLRQQLKDLYPSLLKEDKNESESFIWIIQAMRRINDKVYKEMFPTYLDDQAVDFLYTYADLAWEYDELMKRKIITLGNGMKDSLTLDKAFSNTQTVELFGGETRDFKSVNMRESALPGKAFKELKRTVESRLSSLAKSTLRTAEISNKGIILYHVEDRSDDSPLAPSIDEDLMRFKQGIRSKEYGEKDLESRLQRLKVIIERLKKREIARMISIYVAKDFNEANVSAVSYTHLTLPTIYSV